MFVQTFKILGFIVPEKSLTKFPYALHLRDGEKRRKKEKKNKFQHCGFLLHNTLLPPVYTKSEDSGSHRS